MNYNDDSIVTHPGLFGIRMHRNMYVGDTSGTYGIFHLCKEGGDNSFDETDQDKDNPHGVDFFILQSGTRLQIVIIDDGRGVPKSKLTEICTESHTSGKYADSGSIAYFSTRGTHGMGIKAIAACSRLFAAFSRREQGVQHVLLKDMITIKEGHTEIEETDTGSVFFFEVEESIFPAVRSKFIDAGMPFIQEYLSLTRLFSTNVEINVYSTNQIISDKDFSRDPFELYTKLYNLPTKHKPVYTPELYDTPWDYLNDQKVIGRRVLLELPTARKEFDLEFLANPDIPMEVKDKELQYKVFVYVPEDCGLIGLCTAGMMNKVPVHVKDAHHVKAVLDVLKDNLVQYIPNDERRTYFIDKYRLPICMVIDAEQAGSVRYIGQTKNDFRDADFYERFTESLREFYSEHVRSDVWEKMYRLIKSDFEKAYKRFDKRFQGIVGDGGLRTITKALSDPRIYSECNCEDPARTELLVVEGLSAASTVEQARKHLVETQAVVALTGKFVNAWTEDPKRLAQNKRFKDIKLILGTDMSDTNLERCNFSKIIIVVDPDSNGAHIDALFQAILLKINPELIRQGRVWISSPPLYLLEHGKTQFPIRDETTRFKMMVEGVLDTAMELAVSAGPKGERFAVTTKKGQLQTFCSLIRHLGVLIDRVSADLAIDQTLIELIAFAADEVYGKKLNVSRLKELFNVDDLMYDKASNTLIVSNYGLEIPISLTGTETLIRDEVCRELQTAKLDKTVIWYRSKSIGADTAWKPITPYQLYAVMDELFGRYKVSYFKGLAEISEDQMFNICLNPFSRQLIQITDIGQMDRLRDMFGTNPTERKKLLSAA